MLKISDFEVMGWQHAVRGMRNPKNSHHLSDSSFKEIAEVDICEGDSLDKMQVYFDALSLGENDHKLMMILRNAGTDHRKFMRMITVYVDITAPLYFFKELDQYKVGTVSNSCSTMHKIHAKEFTLDDFSHEHLITDDDLTSYCGEWLTPLDILQITIDTLNGARKEFLETKDKKYWWQMIQLLPSSYNQKRTYLMNYEVLANIYKARKGHKLDEWSVLRSWIEELPYSELITGVEHDVEVVE